MIADGAASDETALIFDNPASEKPITGKAYYMTARDTGCKLADRKPYKLVQVAHMATNEIAQ